MYHISDKEGLTVLKVHGTCEGPDRVCAAVSPGGCLMSLSGHRGDDDVWYVYEIDEDPTWSSADLVELGVEDATETEEVGYDHDVPCAMVAKGTMKQIQEHVCGIMWGSWSGMEE